MSDDDADTGTGEIGDDSLDELEGRTPLVDEGWAVVVATDEDAQAQAIHDRLRLGGLEAYIRDVDPELLADDALPIQVIVPADEAAAAVLELEMALNIKEALGDPGRVDRVAELGFEVDDLEVAELTATGGPVYELDEFGSDDEIREFLEVLLVERIRFSLDRSANLVVHHNDEAKVDEIMDSLFGPERGSGDGAVADAENDASVADEEDAGGLIGETLHVTVSSGTGPSAAVSDVEGRPAVDDVTPVAAVVTSAGPPKWLFAVVGIVLIVLFIVLVV